VWNSSRNPQILETSIAYDDPASLPKPLRNAPDRSVPRSRPRTLSSNRWPTRTGVIVSCGRGKAKGQNSLICPSRRSRSGARRNVQTRRYTGDRRSDHYPSAVYHSLCVV
jgi:hypothetical protein